MTQDWHDRGLAAWAKRLVKDCLLCIGEHGSESTFHAFTKSKNSDKGALLANVRAPTSPLQAYPIQTSLPRPTGLFVLYP